MITQNQRMQKIAWTTDEIWETLKNLPHNNPALAYGALGAVGGATTTGVMASLRKKQLKDVVKASLMGGLVGGGTGAVLGAGVGAYDKYKDDQAAKKAMGIVDKKEKVLSDYVDKPIQMEPGALTSGNTYFDNFGPVSGGLVGGGVGTLASLATMNPAVGTAILGSGETLANTRLAAYLMNLGKAKGAVGYPGMTSAAPVAENIFLPGARVAVSKTPSPSNMVDVAKLMQPASEAAKTARMQVILNMIPAMFKPKK